MAQTDTVKPKEGGVHGVTLPTNGEAHGEALIGVVIGVAPVPEEALLGPEEVHGEARKGGVHGVTPPDLVSSQKEPIQANGVAQDQQENHQHQHH